MQRKFAAYAAIVALSAMSPVAAQAAGQSSAAQDRTENAITAQLNEQQLHDNGGYGIDGAFGFVQSPRQTMLHEQIAQPPSSDSNLSIIE